MLELGESVVDLNMMGHQHKQTTAVFGLAAWRDTSCVASRGHRDDDHEAEYLADSSVMAYDKRKRSSVLAYDKRKRDGCGGASYFKIGFGSFSAVRTQRDLHRGTLENIHPPHSTR